MKNSLHLILLLTFASLPVSMHSKPSIQASRSEAAQSTRPESTPEAKTEQGEPSAALAQRSNEAAGKEEKGEKSSEDQEEQLKHSTLVHWFAAHVGLKNHPDLAYWIFVCLNFAVLASAIPKIWVLSLRFFNLPLAREHRANVKAKFEDARKASDDANRRLSAIDSKLSRLDVDIAAIRAEAEAINKAEGARLQASIEEERKKIVLGSQQEIEAAAAQARRELKIYAADLAVSLAEKKINVDEATDKALVRSFSDQINAGKDGR